MIGFGQKSLEIVAVTHQPMLRDLDQEPMQALLSLHDLLRLVVVPVDQGVLRWDRRDDTGGEAALQNLEKPLEIFISTVHVCRRLSSHLLLHSSLDLVQTEATATTRIIILVYIYLPSLLRPLGATDVDLLVRVELLDDLILKLAIFQFVLLAHHRRQLPMPFNIVVSIRWLHPLLIVIIGALLFLASEVIVDLQIRKLSKDFILVHLYLHIELLVLVAIAEIVILPLVSLHFLTF
jgi:hypothetical protein